MATNLTSETYELIEQYLRNELTEKQLTAFKNRLETDPEFAKAVANEESIQQVVAFKAQKDLKTRLETIQKEYLANRTTPEETSPKQPTKVIPLYRKYWYLGAAAAALIAAVIAFNLWVTPSLSTEQLYAQHYTKPAFDQSRGENGITEAKSAYENRDYTKAIALLSNFPENPKLQQYKGIAELESNQYPKAIATFQNLQSNLDHGGSATWYLAMTYLRSNNMEACKRELTKLTSGNIETTNKQKAKAAKLLKQLENIK